MKLKSFLQTSSVWRAGLVLLAIVASLVAGASPFVLSSPMSPLIVGGAVVATVLSLAFLQNPLWALYTVIFLIFFPQGLIPGNLHSMSIILILLLASLSWLLKVGFQRQRIVWVSTNLLMVGFLMWSVITLLWAPDLVRGRQELVQYTIDLALLVLLVNEIDSLKTLDGLMNILALNGWGLALAGVGTILLHGYAPGTGFTVLGMNKNLFGISLIIAMPGVLWYAVRSSERQRPLKMLLSVIFILLTLVFVALSGSRGSAISLLATLLAFWFLKPTRPWGKLGLLILALAVISAPFVFSTVVRRFSGDEDEGPLGGRMVLWQASALLIRDHLWRGVGIGNGSYVMPSYLHAITNLYWHRQERMSAHNPLLDVWADTGLPGVLLYLGVLGSAVWLFIRRYFLLDETKTEGRYLVSYFAIVSCVFIGYMLSWIKGGGMRARPTYFFMLALLLIASRLSANKLDDSMQVEVKRSEGIEMVGVNR